MGGGVQCPFGLIDSEVPGAVDEEQDDGRDGEAGALGEHAESAIGSTGMPRADSSDTHGDRPAAR